MLLGKRPRPPIKRTTSITEFTLDLTYKEPPASPCIMAHEDTRLNLVDPEAQDLARRISPVVVVEEGFDRQFLAATVSPRTHRRYSGDFLETTPHFLRACGLCKRRLAPTRDIYMYRGDTAFCSLDCRQQQMNLDELKEKCSSSSVESEASSKGGTTVTDRLTGHMQPPETINKYENESGVRAW